MARLLLIEDDHDLSFFVRGGLGMDEHEVDCVDTGAAASERLDGYHYDLLIVDWDLPDITGIDLCKRLRDAGDTRPILMLTGRRNITDKESGFDAGADDYLTKPFEMKELCIRVRALLRRAVVNVAGTGNVVGSDSAGPIQVGQVIAGKYRLEEYLSQGGMALVYRATHIGMGKPVVVKLVQAHLLNDEKTLLRFEQECQIMARIDHPSVASVFDTGLVNDSQPYMVMEYVSGESLSNRLAREGALPLATSLDILIQVCEGLEEAHRAGIVHRDLKPSNIMLQERGDCKSLVKIIDFGIAHLMAPNRRLTETGMILGSAGYMAPEQLRDLPIDARTDIYSLGMIFFEMLTCALPFKASNTEAFYVKQLTEQPELLSSQRPEIAPQSNIDLLVQKAIARDPALRFQSVSELRLALEQAHREFWAGKDIN